MTATLRQEPERPHVAHLEFDFNDLNLLTVEISREIQETIESVPDEVSVLTITADQSSADDGEVRGLTAGLNLDWASDLSPHEGYDLLQAIYDMNQAVRDLEAVVVCGCGEYTLGAGFELAIACEFRLATPDSALGLPEVNVGLPTVVHGGLLIRLAGEQVASELIYTGATIDGERAKEMGVVNRVVPQEEYAGELDALVDELAEKSPEVMQFQKLVMKRFRSLGLEEGMKASVGDAGRAFDTPDQQEAMQAFLEDREPEF